MDTAKEQIIKKVNESKYCSREGSFGFRVAKLIRDGEFAEVLDSAGVTHLLNEGPGKKIKANNLTALMNPLQREDIVKVKIVGKGRNKRKYWFPAWINKKRVENEISSLGFSEHKIFFVTGSNAWTDYNENFPKIINALKGDLCIVDPLYGNGTFSTLAKFGKKRNVQFLSATLGNDEQNNTTDFNINLKKFKSQFKNIKLKKYDKFWELHDRYIIADNALVVIGHGIKDFGGKESFVIFLPRETVSNFLPNLKSIFKKRWGQSKDIK